MPIHYRNTKPTLQTFNALNLIGLVYIDYLVIQSCGDSTNSLVLFPYRSSIRRQCFDRLSNQLSDREIYLSARIGLVRKSSYAMRIPSRSSVLYVQPRAVALLTSNSLRGVPFGRVVSHSILPS